jgi:hypothetical protein
MAKKRYNAQAQVVCAARNGYRTSVGLTTVFDIYATTKKGAERIAKKTWRSRGELPVPGMKHKARCVIHPSVEEAY